jgi:hypothetical protein
MCMYVISETCSTHWGSEKRKKISQENLKGGHLDVTEFETLI